MIRRGLLRRCAFSRAFAAHAAERGEPAAEHEERNLRKAGHESERREHAAGHRHRARLRAELRREHLAHPRAARRVRHHDAGGGADDQRRDLRDETVADREDRVLRQRLADRQSALERADEDAADDVDRRDEQAGDRVALHELRRAVHRAVEVGLARDLVAALARLLLVDEAGAQIGVDRHLLAGHRVQREARRDFGDAAGALRDDDEVDADQDQEEHEPDDVVAADHELAERLNDRAGMPLGENQPRAADVEREPEQREEQQQRREAAELERIGRVQRDEQHDERRRRCSSRATGRA